MRTGETGGKQKCVFDSEGCMTLKALGHQYTPELRGSRGEGFSYIFLGKDTSESELCKVFVHYC